MDVTGLTEEQIEILRHTDRRAANGAYCGDSGDMQVLVRRGFMKSLGSVAWCPDEYFGLTAAGREALRELGMKQWAS